MYKVEINNKGGMLFDVKANDYQFVIDAKGKGLTPPDALLAALGSCIGVYIRKYAEGAKLDIGPFKVTVESEFDAGKPVRFKDIKVTVNLKDAGLDERRKNAMLDFVKNCPVHNTLKGGPRVDIAIMP